MTMIRPFSAIVLVGLVAGCSVFERPPELRGDAAEVGDFKVHIKPIFERRCVRCHNAKSPAAGLNFQDRENVLAGKRLGGDGRFLVAGDPGASLIYNAITHPADHPMMMPGDGWGLNQSQERNLREWIERGAMWPQGRAGRLEERALRVEFDDYR
jgi:hypothetical protein